MPHHDSRPPDSRRGLLRIWVRNPQIAQHLWRLLIHRQQVVTGVAVLRDRTAVFGRMAAIVASETARKFRVPQMIRIRAQVTVIAGKTLRFHNASTSPPDAVTSDRRVAQTCG